MRGAALALLLTLALGMPAFGATCRDVQFPDSVKVGNTDLVLNGLGIHVFMGEDWPRMAANSMRNLAEDRIRSLHAVLERI